MARAQHLRAKPLKVLVGRVGIKPTTNGLRVQGTRAGAGRKPQKRNGDFAGTRIVSPRPNLCRTPVAFAGGPRLQFRCASRGYGDRRRTLPRTRTESAAACRKVGAVCAREQSAACWILRRLPDPYPAVGRAESGRPRCHERPSDYHETLCYIRLRLPSYRYRGMWAAQLSLDAYTGLSTCRIRMATSTPSMEAIRNRPKT